LFGSCVKCVSVIIALFRPFAIKTAITVANNTSGMFEANSMTIDNMNSALRGWAKLDTAAGETAIQSNVNWGIVDYTDATARQYLIDTYHWTINAVKTVIKDISTTCTS
jgi:hypothetical protein